eukprot:00615.XXX_1770_2497_1 [CDS] Oithona nana genome sequencing.
MSDQPGPSKPKTEPERDEKTMTLAEYLSLPENQNANLVMPLEWCPHLEEVLEDFNKEDFDVSRKCQSCENVGENWICLSCHNVFCSRYVQEHMLIHSVESSHPLALSFSDLSTWCFVCDDYITNDRLYKLQNALHQNKFDGESMPRKSGNNMVLEMMPE